MVLIKDINTTAVFRLLIAYYFISKKRQGKYPLWKLIGIGNKYDWKLLIREDTVGNRSYYSRKVSITCVNVFIMKSGIFLKRISRTK